MLSHGLSIQQSLTTYMLWQHLQQSDICYDNISKNLNHIRVIHIIECLVVCVGYMHSVWIGFGVGGTVFGYFGHIGKLSCFREMLLEWKLCVTSTDYFFLQVVGSLVGHTSSIECIGISSRYSSVNVVAPASAFMHITSLLYPSACPEKQNVGCMISVGKWLYVWILRAYTI